MQVMIESATDVPTKDRKRRDKLAARACVLCNQAHTACDDERPCKRCVSKNIAHLCRDAEPRKRGRPAKPPEQYDLELQQAQRRNNAAMQIYQNGPLLSLPSNGYNFTQALELSSANTLELDYETSSLLTDIPLSPSFEPSSLLIQDIPSPASYQVSSPPIQLPEVQYNHVSPQQTLFQPQVPISVYENKIKENNMALQSPICPPGFGFMTPSCTLHKFTEEHLGQVFTRLANKAGYPEMTPDIRNTMTKVVQFYAPLVQQYGANILEMCPVRLMSVTQMVNENTLPVIVAGCFFMITCNHPAYELTGLKKSDIGRGTVSNWKFIFDLLHKDDAVPFIKKSVECLTSFSDLDRMKVRILVPDGVFECVVSETIHRSPSGVPLFSSFTFVRIDDLK